MFLFELAPWYSYLMWVVVVAGLMLLNELARLNKWAGLTLFVLVPILLTIFVWPQTAGATSSTGTWFHWAKVYSALAGCLGFMYLRYSKTAASNKYWLLFPPLILSINILEAVVRDFQVYALYSGDAYGTVVNHVTMMGGGWNIMNGVAGIINIVTITGWMGIFISKDKKQDMLWPDMIWPWIIAYDLWNFAYVYNCVGDHAFYAGAALLVSCTIPAFYITRGAWLQHRAQTLAFWMMFTMSFPMFVDTSIFKVDSSHSEVSLYVMSGLALVSNLVVLGAHLYKVIKYRRNPLKQEIYLEAASYQHVASRRHSK